MVILNISISLNFLPKALNFFFQTERLGFQLPFYGQGFLVPPQIFCKCILLSQLFYECNLSVENIRNQYSQGLYGMHYQTQETNFIKLISYLLLGLRDGYPFHLFKVTNTVTMLPNRYYRKQIHENMCLYISFSSVVTFFTFFLARSLIIRPYPTSQPPPNLYNRSPPQHAPTSTIDQSLQLIRRDCKIKNHNFKS